MNSPQIWMITGSGSGFGRRFIPAILRRGDKVIATSRKLESLADLPSEVSAEGLDVNNLRTIALDLSWDTPKIQDAVKEALDVWGHVDVLVNNGGVGMKSLIEEADASLFRQQFQVNVFGAIDVTNAILPSMRARKSGTVVMMGSRSSWRPELPATGLYASSKAALTAYSETLATELGFFGIRVLIVQPSSFRTEKMLAYPYHDEKRIPEYDLLRGKALAGAAALDGKQPGDPVKGVNLVIDVVKGEGKAKGRKFPRYLPLGEGAGQAIIEKTNMMKEVLEDWGDLVGADLHYDTPGEKLEYA